MNSAVVVVGLALVLAVQIAIHLRIAGIPARIAVAKQISDGAKRPEADAFQEALARRLNLILRGIQGYHEHIAEDFRAQVASGEQRARLAEGRTADTAGPATELRAALREMASLVAELRALQGDLAELVAEMRRSPVGRPAAASAAASPPAAPAAPTSDDPDERRTLEMASPKGSAPAEGAPARAEAAPPCAEAASESADDEGWDDPEEKTKLFGKDGTSATPREGKDRRALLPGARS